jgi:hypothetical protein
MATLTDMPTELIQAVALYLPPSDKKNLALTCKDLNQAVRLELFRCVFLGFHGTNYKTPNMFDAGVDDNGRTMRNLPIPIPTFTCAGHRLVRMIRENVAIASRIESMIINLEPCCRCYGEVQQYIEAEFFNPPQEDEVWISNELHCRQLFTPDTLKGLSRLETILDPIDFQEMVDWVPPELLTNWTPPSPTDSMPASPTTDSRYSPTTDLMSMLPALKSLVVRAAGRFNPEIFPLPPNLESLTLGYPLAHHVWILPHELAHTLFNCGLKSLVLAGVTLEHRRWGYGRPRALCGHDGAISTITSLELQHVSMKREILTALLGCLGALTYFKFAIGTTNVYQIDVYGTDVPSLADVSFALQQNQQLSLREVEISYSDRWRTYESRKGGLLDLKGVSSLKKVTVDPAMLLGWSLCPPDSNHWIRFRRTGGRAQIYQGADEIASRLPDSLEELNLIIDLEQAARIPEYREGILDSLYASLPGFPHLRRITFLEDPLTQACKQCQSEGDAKILPSQAGFHNNCPTPGPRTDDHLYWWSNGQFPARTDEQALHFSEFQDKFQKKGVQLSYSGEPRLTKPPGQ